MKPSVLLDVDEVVADFVGRYLYLASYVTGEKYKHADVKEWNVASALKLSEKEKAAVDYWLSQPGVALAIHPLPGAVDGVRKLSGLADVIFVTAPLRINRTWAQDRYDWIEKYFGRELARNMVFANVKTPVLGDMMVDDRPEHLVPWKEKHGKPAILWDSGHNQNFSDPRIPRLSSWDQLCEIVKEL